MPSSDPVLRLFHPLIGRWFAEQVGKPTAVQKAAWPKIAAGEHVLASAPTGSGKTLAAFLWALNQLFEGRWETGAVSVLYVSPLKALNNDIHRNLLAPLRELRDLFIGAGQAFPEISVATRSGDTPQSDRRRMLRHPPDILITTPESLNLLLSAAGSLPLLSHLKTVILDEIHAVIDSKRGTHLITAVERLVPLSGEFQRIALSATVRPMDQVAAFIGGYRMEGNGTALRYWPRPVSLIQTPESKTYDIHIRFPESAHDTLEDFWTPLAGEFKSIIRRNRSTLFFTRGRRMAEKITLSINTGEQKPVAYAHHGSLSREIRFEVEQNLKAGVLKAIVATSSLELGIDIGALDEVVLIQTPLSIASAVQRIGRAGHRVGETSRGSIYPVHDHDFLEAAVIAESILSRDIEPVRPVQCPLDVLAQVLVSMACTGVWTTDGLYDSVRTSAPYHHLERKHFDLVLDMLAGRYEALRIRDLRPKLSVDGIENTVAAARGARLSLLMSGGTIPDRGYFHLRHESGSLIGELDEEFVWEASTGQTLTLGTQNWTIERITHNDVFVKPAGAAPSSAPFWRAEGFDRGFHFSEKIALFLERAEPRLDDPAFTRELVKSHSMDTAAAERLVFYLKRQKEETRCGLPHRHHLVVEHVASGPKGSPGHQVILHTFWGARVNRPFAMALDALWEDRFGHRLQIFPGNDSIVLQLADDFPAGELLSMIREGDVRAALRKRLEGTGYFGARFREAAGRALLLSRTSLHRRMPLWMLRLKSQKLMDAVSRLPDFPILLEAWRTCLQDEFDMAALETLLSELNSGAIRVSECVLSHASPMAGHLAWQQVNQYMYMGDEAAGRASSSLRADLLRDIVFTPALRPAVPAETVAAFVLKRQRLVAGYTPRDDRDLVDWIKERVLLPLSEWEALREGIRRDHSETAEECLKAAGEKLFSMKVKEEYRFICAREMAGHAAAAFFGGLREIELSSLSGDPIPNSGKEPVHPLRTEDAGDASPLLIQFLSYYGPVSLSWMLRTIPVEESRLISALEDGLESGQLIRGGLVQDGPEDDFCDAENFEIMLRIARAGRAPRIETLESHRLPLFLAVFQGLTAPGKTPEDAEQLLEQLLCVPAPPGFWEEEILPARLKPYLPFLLDHLVQKELRWIGLSGGRVTFCFEPDLDLLSLPGEGKGVTGEDPDGLSALFPDPNARYDFSALLRSSGLSPSVLTGRLWDFVWKSRVTNDHFEALRKGILTRYRIADAADPVTSGGRIRTRSRFSRYRGSMPYTGNWLVLFPPAESGDLIEREEQKKDRVRILLERYGILFRELLERELPCFRWPALFRTLRIMEFSGEVAAGYYFAGIAGPQFASRKALAVLEKGLPESAVYWMNAADPASCCGLGMDAFKGSLPPRIDSTHLSYRGSTLAMVSRRHGSELLIHVPPEDTQIGRILGVLNHLLHRSFQPLNRITVRTINGTDAAKSPYLPAFRAGFDLSVAGKEITLYRRIPGGRAPQKGESPQEEGESGDASGRLV